MQKAYSAFLAYKRQILGLTVLIEEISDLVISCLGSASPAARCVLLPDDTSIRIRSPQIMNGYVRDHSEGVTTGDALPALFCFSFPTSPK